jgi:glycine oxidase
MPAKGEESVERYDVVFVGGGPIGLASAWRAAQRGLRVVVLERDRVGSGAASVAAGRLAPTTEADFGEEELLRLNLDSLRAYPSFVEELEAETGVEVDFLACGTLSVALDRDGVEELRRVQRLYERLALGAEWLLPSEVRALEPGLTPGLAAGLHVPEEYAVDPRKLVAALAAALGDRVVEGADVTAALLEGDRIVGVETSRGRRFHADTVVAAAGAWGAPWLPEGARPPVRPVKGEVLILRGAAPTIARNLRSVGAQSVYLVPRGDGRVVVGATSLERGFDATVTAGGVLELLREAYRLVPEVAELELLEARTSFRPASPDNRPIVGPGALEGLVLATGHYRNGILLTPATAVAVADLLAGVAA